MARGSVGMFGIATVTFAVSLATAGAGWCQQATPEDPARPVGWVFGSPATAEVETDRRSDAGGRTQVPGDVNGDGTADAGDVACAVATAFGDIGCAVVPLWGGLPETGQKTCTDDAGTIIPCAGTGQDGDLRAGGGWPSPRFEINGDGTVTDRLTGLVWLRDASCADLPLTDSFGAADWETALVVVNSVQDGICGLADGSAPGDWRLPNVREILSLVDYEYWNPAVPDTAGTGQCTEGDPFWGVEALYYWTSTSYSSGGFYAWTTAMHVGNLLSESKTSSRLIWPVREGE